MNQFCIHIHSPVGLLEITGDETAIQSIRFGRKNRDSTDLPAVAKKCMKELAQYFAGERSTFTFPLKTDGTAFQQKAWQALRAVANGETVTYAAVAQAIGHAKAARAVGSACKKNPVAIAIPCHRIVGKGNPLRYNGGAAKKKWLLRHEKVIRI